MAAPPIYNPPIPYLAPIPGGMSPGRMMRVQGSVPHGAQRFAINLQCGPNTDPRDDMALHLNFRFVERCVVRNNLINMQWGPEETSGGLPLNPGTGFECLILCDPQSYKIALNGVHFGEFIHRLPFQRVSHLTIDGDVHINTITFEGDANPGYNGGVPAGMAYSEPGFAPPAYGGPPPPYSSQPVYSAQSAPMMSSMPGGHMVQGQQRSGGIGTGTALGLGVGGMAAAGLAGYALGGGFSSDSPEHTAEAVHVAEPSFDDGGDFGGDDWMD